VRAAGRAEEGEHGRRPALGVGLRMVAGQDGQKGGFARPWIERCYTLHVSGFSGIAATHRLRLVDANDPRHGWTR